MYFKTLFSFIEQGFPTSAQHSHYTRRAFLSSPMRTHSATSVSTMYSQNRPLDALNTYLVSRDVSPVRSQLQTSWEKTSGRTKRYYTRKASQGVAALVQDMTPHETGPLFRALCSSDVLRRQLSDEDNMDNMDVTLMEALAECYQATSRWETRRQILSIMADKVRYKTLLKFFPGLTKYRFTEAKRHCLTYGRGAPVLSVRAPRTDVTFSQIEHFIAFITS